MTFPELGLSVIIVLELTCLIAYFLKGFSGFGPALIFIPVVAYLIGPRLALTSSAFLDFIVGVIMLMTFKYSKSDWQLIAKISLFMTGGIIIGGYLVSLMSVNLILIVIAVLVFCVGLSLILLKQTVPNGINIKHPKLLWLGSFIGGIGGGLAGIAGPFIIMMIRPHMDKSSFRRILVAVFLVGGLVRLVVYSSVNMWSQDVLTLSLITAPAIAIGLTIGYFSHFSVNETWFSRIIGLLLLAISIRILTNF
ncbi:MAG: sulfite exporter TauE/SafE family protein [candidate division Zixibacteria bacterium]|nr:sulfite exporter TauE/SafE family protein [candidate division Zixibacteria bacterium]